MPQNDAVSLAQAISDPARRSQRFIWSAETQVALGDLGARSSLDCSIEELRARSVLILTRDQLTAALALIQRQACILWRKMLEFRGKPLQ